VTVYRNHNNESGLHNVCLAFKEQGNENVRLGESSKTSKSTYYRVRVIPTITLDLSDYADKMNTS
jgi:hypothetical protein